MLAASGLPPKKQEVIEDKKYRNRHRKEAVPRVRHGRRRHRSGGMALFERLERFDPNTVRMT